MMNTEKINMDHEGVEVPDYYGEDGLLYCGVCHEPKEAYLPEGKEWLGRKTHPRMCLCDRTEYERQEKREKQLEHEQEVYWSSFLVTLCSEIMLYIETPLVSYSYSLNEVSHSCTS